MENSLNAKQIERDDKLMEFLSSKTYGVSHVEIARKFNVTVEQVDQRINELKNNGHFIWTWGVKMTKLPEIQ